MTLEFLFVVVLLGVAFIPLLTLLGGIKVSARTAVKANVVLWLGLTLLFVSTPFLCSDRSLDRERGTANRPLQLPAGDFVGSAACQSCHPHNHATWHDSYHRTMTQVANEQSVLGDFNNVSLSGKDFHVRLFRQDQRFFVEMNPTNALVENVVPRGVFPVVMTTGSHHRQAYWLATGQKSRQLMILPYMYLKAEQRWIPRHSGYINSMCLQESPELAVLQADFGRWSTTCIKCHTTHGRPAPADEQTGKRTPDTTATQAVEFGISCEACHGPGAAHVRANRNPLRRYNRHLADGVDATIVNPARLPHDRSSQVCGQCHSVIYHRSDEAQKQWVHHGYSYRPGDDLFADPIRFLVRGRPELMPDRPHDLPPGASDGSFWSDGMIRASGREYNGLLDSPCYQRGQLSCLSCHQMHQSRGEPRSRQDWADDQLKLGMDGNSACLQCHTQFNDAERLTRHTHHPAHSSGSQCYNCHMPYTTYGILKAMRSHQIDSPSVQVSLDTGRPNACNQCHLDKTLGWSAEKLSRWYGAPRPKLSTDEQQIAASVLWALRGDAGQRALMAWSYGWKDALETSGNQWQAPFLGQLLEDRYDAVRFIALRSLRRLPGFSAFQHDFNAPPDQRSAAHQRARQDWTQSGRQRSAQPALLLDDQGRVVESEFQRLWRQRDDRVMNVNE